MFRSCLSKKWLGLCLCWNKHMIKTNNIIHKGWRLVLKIRNLILISLERLQLIVVIKEVLTDTMSLSSRTPANFIPSKTNLLYELCGHLSELSSHLLQSNLGTQSSKLCNRIQIPYTNQNRNFQTSISSNYTPNKTKVAKTDWSIKKMKSIKLQGIDKNNYTPMILSICWKFKESKVS